METKTGTAVALGMFDGMHLGHQKLIRELLTLAKTRAWRAVIFTFFNHPMSVLGNAPSLLSTADERRNAMLAAGVDAVDMVAFDTSMARTAPEAFIRMLQERYCLKAVVAGFNYTFGAQGKGNADLLRKIGGEEGFETHIVEPVSALGAEVSSSRIRAFLQDGDVTRAAALLGAHYRLSGTVVGNRHIGTQIGFPTANIQPDPVKLLPKHGVYVTRAKVDGVFHAAVTNVGVNPTVNGTKVSVETHLLDFSGDLYGKPMEIDFIEYIRGESRFSSKEALAQQIAKDAQYAHNVLKV